MMYSISPQKPYTTKWRSMYQIFYIVIQFGILVLRTSNKSQEYRFRKGVLTLSSTISFHDNTFALSSTLFNLF